MWLSALYGRVRVRRCQVMSYCLSSSLFAGMEAHMRQVEAQLGSPSADFALHSTQLHAQYVQQFEGPLSTQCARSR